MIKKCFKCNEEKEINQFYKHSAMSDGFLGKCKECAKKDSFANRLKNIEKIRAYDRKRGNRQSYEYVKEYRKKYPKKYKAFSLVSRAIKSGKMKKLNCEKCGSIDSVAHHDDYNFPLTIRWLCQAHHKQWHAKNGEGENPF